MARKLISRKQLAAHLTSEIRKVEDCDNLLIGSVIPLQFPDASGCNWSPDVMVSTGGVPLSYFGPYLSEIVSKARNKFNLLDESEGSL